MGNFDLIAPGITSGIASGIASGAVGRPIGAGRPIGLVFLIGLPGSGKSTLAQALLRAHPGAALVSTDQIRADKFGDAAVQGPWEMVWQEVGRQFLGAADRISRGQCPLAIYDATNGVREQRLEAIALARDCRFTQIQGIWVNPGLAVCLARNRARARQVPEAVIERMARRLNELPPALADGFDQLTMVPD
jgi:predicted kinase